VREDAIKLDWAQHVEKVIWEDRDRVREWCEETSCPYKAKSCPDISPENEDVTSICLKAMRIAGQIFAQKAVWN